MADLEIVHISDLHWASSQSQNLKVVVEPLINDLADTKQKSLINPDLVVFTGDFVNSGEDKCEFNAAYEEFMVPAINALGLNKNCVFLCPGNHDISRKSVRDAEFIDRGLRSSLSSVDSTNNFLDRLKNQNLADLMAVERTDNYYSFVDSVIPDPIYSGPLLRCYQRNVRGIQVGIASFDTAWRATGEADDVDKNYLLLGERNVDDAIESLKAADLRLGLMHHPLEWLAEFDELAVSSRLSAHFDALFCGHMHRANPQTRTSAQGTAIFSQTGSAYASRRWFNGYQTLKINLAEAECEFLIRTYYDTPRREFDKATNIHNDGYVKLPFVPQKKSTSDAVVESFLRATRPIIRIRASDHFNMLDDVAFSKLDAKEAFVVPPLSKRIVETNSQGASTPAENYIDLSVDEILRDHRSYLLSGGREVGKTSLLHYLSVLSAEGIIDRPRIPVVLNVEYMKTGLYELKRAIHSYFGSSPKGFDLDREIDAGSFIFLCDNYINDTVGSAALESHIKTYPGNRWIVISRPRLGSITGDVDDAPFLSDFVKVHIRALPRKSIRALSNRWSAAIGSDNQDVFDVVMKQLKADGLPRTGYMVMLILWAMQQEKELDRVNEAMLLSNVVDYLLGKADFTQSRRGNLDPRAKEITLEYLAEYISDCSGYAPINDVTTFLSNLFQSKRLPFVSTDVLPELVKCGILERRDDIISFKYKCFEEYFYALRMKSEPSLLEDSLKRGNYPLREREIEILAGLRRQNADLITAISSDMESRRPASISNISRADLLAMSNSSMGFSLSTEQLSDLRRKRLTTEQVDDLLDAADRRAIKKQEEDLERENNRHLGDKDSVNHLVLLPEEPDEMSVGEYIVASELLARVVKNSDFTDFEHKEPAARLVLQTFVKICAHFKQEIEKILKEQGEREETKHGLKPEEMEILVYIITNLLTRIVADRMAEQLSAPNISPLIAEICDDRETTPIERMFLVFLLQSLRSENWEVQWGDLLKDSGKSGFIMENSIGKMRAIVNSQFLNDLEYRKLHKVIDAAEEVLGWTPAQRDYVIEDLKKVALQAELRDSA
ncbi:metallophosphoesterase family protein [Sphingomonas colocasiae]|uniref:Metallophosphoesterase n=1 Tax=Sphingomonas colocasiae TaxID=1848973 RepID=A0ABS7PTY6_9SPHN|nr:metallophosphoesterase [Sphingomonas colocasiae]MBY8823862.1 metallophosphoesterase [Sphingomonas colocasiae]